MDYCLKLGNIKMESLVIADQNAAVNDKLGFVHTAHHAREVKLAGWSR